MRGLAFCWVLALASCTSAIWKEPTIIEVLPAGYRVDGRPVATASDLRQHLMEMRISRARVVALMDTSLVRVQETHAALRDAGVEMTPAR
jgi:hypothetical protein